ncbi:CO3-like protein [Mya arenaria]|uniref:CO3-like protein n=1 Tax=Mya arenaria TaxID=6604 RepID=A0ABY7FH06_MYAAR|nr:CO3-like protein [Mya arenaria]
MKLLVLGLVLLLGTLEIFCDRQFWYAIAPNVVRYNHEETVLVGVIGSGSASMITVWFEIEGTSDQISRRVVTISSQENPQLIRMSVTSEDIDKMKRTKGKPNSILLKASFPNGGTYSRKIFLSYKSGYLIVQTDKPLYTPLETVKVRVLAMEESLKPVKSELVNIEILAPNETKSVGRLSCSGTKGGFCRKHMTLPPYPTFGEWTIRATMGGKYDTTTVVPFEVKEFVVPTFGVSITTSRDYILDKTSSIEVTVDATYVYGKKVEGNAGLKVNIAYIGSMDNQKEMITARKDLINGVAAFTVKIPELRANYGPDFPDGARLMLEANVYEEATGKEETEYDDSILFTKSPFKFDFSRSKKSYRPGMTYYLQIDMSYSNGRPAVEKEFVIKFFDGIQEQRLDDFYTTNTNGQMTKTFATTSTSERVLKFQIFAKDYPDDIVNHTVNPYKGANQIGVEEIEREGIEYFRANTNIKGATSSGILMMVVARGQIVYSLYKKDTFEINEKMEKDIPKTISPEGRLLALYVDKVSGEIVADSTEFSVDPQCKSTQLTVEPERTEIYPGNPQDVTVTGPSDAWVGFNVMDKALLLLNDKNILQHDTVFRALKEHDLGCGAGGGVTSEEVFKNAGLTIVTNANVDDTSIQRKSDTCRSENTRKKRSMNDCLPGVEENCCTIGVDYANIKLDEHYDLKHHFDPDVLPPKTHLVCMSMVRSVVGHFTRGCLLAMYKSCIRTMNEDILDNDELEGRSILDDDGLYANDFAKLVEMGFTMKKRTNFETSFFFEEHQLQNGALTLPVMFKDSITEWSIQAISITENEGACIAEPKTVKTFKDFFIQLDLPYKATRLEHIKIKATIFNYASKTLQANVYLKGIDGLCYGTSPDKNSPPRVVKLESNKAMTVSFSAIPLRAGRYPIIVSAFVTDGDIQKVDIVEKELQVVNEGIMVKKTISVCLDPNDQMKDCERSEDVSVTEPLYTGGRSSRQYIVDLSLHPASLPDTGSATAYVESNLMDNIVDTVINGIDKLFNQPHGCGEQTMMYTAPIVYGLDYLAQTGQTTQKHEVQGIEWMRYGINREWNEFRLPDGSYHKWEGYDTSIWLTAFVAKVFCQANQVVDGIVDENGLVETLKYLASKSSAGTYKEIEHVRMSNIQGIFGKDNKGTNPVLSAFVLITLQECSLRENDQEAAVIDIMNYLEIMPQQIYTSNPYLLAITTYALALSNSGLANSFKELLYSKAHQTQEHMYWSHGTGQGNAESVETTAYALLAAMQFDDFRTSAKIVTWLALQRDAIGAFHTTQDTVVALQALSKYSARTFNPETNIEISMSKINAKPSWTKSISINKDNALQMKIIQEIPVSRGQNTFRITATGSGTGRMKIELRWNRPPNDGEICPFEISHIEVGEVNPVFAGNDNKGFNITDGECDICGHCPNDPSKDNAMDISADVDQVIELGRRKRQAAVGEVQRQKCIRFTVSSKDDQYNAMMSIVKIDLETGVKAVEYDLKQITREPIAFIFRLDDEFDGQEHSRQPASVTVYDYYQPGCSNAVEEEIMEAYAAYVRSIKSKKPSKAKKPFTKSK